MKFYEPENYNYTIHTVHITLQVYDRTIVLENKFARNITGAEVLSLYDDPDFMFGTIEVISGSHFIKYNTNGLIRIFFDEGWRDFTSEELLDYIVKLEIVGVQELNEHS